MAQNMYRVGDYVYFETFPSSPYQVRRIEELTKTPTETVEARVTCFYRRRDLPVALLKIADQAERQDRILSRPRRCLLSRNEGASTSNGDGVKAEAVDDEADPKENGMDVSEPTPAAPSTDASKSPEGEKADNQQQANEKKIERSYGFAGLPLGANALSAKEVHALRQQELFLSRQTETLSASQIRGKCTVVILSEVETAEMYLGRDDAFFYSLVYDPSNQSLLVDKGRIEIGERNQAKIPPYQGEWTDEGEGDGKENGGGSLRIAEEEDGAGAGGATSAPTPNTATTQPLHPPIGGDLGLRVTDRETIVYHPHHNLTDRDIDQFLIIARAVGTFSRALDSSSTMKLPSLHMTASAASRDVTLLHAMALLHQAHYEIGQAAKFLVPPPSKLHYPLDADKVTSHNTVSLGGPILCRDQLEEWSAAEAALFEDGMARHNKDFHEIRLDALPWKSHRDCIEYYYMWKTTNRYTDSQKSKQAEQENRLKQVYIPSFNKQSPNLVGPPNPTGQLVKSPSPCESCKKEESVEWYGWGPALLQLRLCKECWVVWKKRGGLKNAHEYEVYDLEGDGSARAAGRAGYHQSLQQGRAGGVGAGAGARGNNGSHQQNIAKVYPQQHTASAMGGSGPKGRAAFFLNTTLQARIARRMAPKPTLNMRKAARSPFKSIDGKAITSYYYARPLEEVLRVARQVRRGGLSSWAIEYLNRLHAKNSASGGGGGGTGGGGGGGNGTAANLIAAAAAGNVRR